MLINNRFIFKHGGTITDYSRQVNNVFADSAVPVFADGDFLYIGSDFPFNHRYFQVGIPNIVAANTVVEIWNGSEWKAAADVVDQTSVSGAPLAQNGIISWSTDRNSAWARALSTELMTGSGIETLKIYDMFWIRLSFDETLTATASIKYVGHNFSNDSDLGGKYPDLNRSNVLTAFLAGKTSWIEQHILAAEEVIRDLRKSQIVFSANQIFGYDEFNDAAVHKVAEIIYTAFGNDYAERRDQARVNYDEALDKVTQVAIDKNADGFLEHADKLPQYGRLRRA